MRGRGEGSIRQRTRKDGSTFWEARVVVDGRQCSFYADTKSGAMAKSRAARSDAERGMSKPRDGVTVGEYLTDWLELHAKGSVRSRTFRSYSQHVTDYINPAIGKLKLVDLVPGHVTRMLAKLLSRGLSESTVRNARATLSGALKQAQIDYGLPTNAASLAKMPKGERPVFEREVLTPADARQILDAFKDSRHLPVIMFAIATGMRQGEQLGLRWQDVDEARGQVNVRHAVDVRDGKRVLGRPKTAKSQRPIPLAALAIQALALRRQQMEEDRILAGDAWEGGEFVFANPTGGMRDGTSLTNNFKIILKSHGLKPIRWHALRRVFAALLQDQGVPLVVIRDLMGHCELRVTETYAYVVPGALDSMIGKLDAALGLDPAEASPESTRVGVGYETRRAASFDADGPLQKGTSWQEGQDSNLQPADLEAGHPSSEATDDGHSDSVNAA